MTDGEFKRIILPCYREMYSMAFAILRNAEDASDVVQDAMTSLWQMHSRQTVPDNPMAFCNSVVRNIAVDRIRRNSKAYFECIEALYMIASDERPDADVSLKITEDCIREVLMKFKMSQRKVLILSLFSQLSNQEISEITGESSENVRKVLSRGRKKIKEYLSDEN